MANTEFGEFAQALAVTFQGDRSPEQFTQDMFLDMYLPVSDENPVETTLPRTYKGYFYGEHDITVLAKKIAGSLDPDSFAEKIVTETDSSIQHICDTFRPFCPAITADNYNKQIALRFQNIIEAAAKTKKRNKTSTAKEIEDTKQIAVSAENKYGAFLVAEAGSICPDCHRKPLFAYTEGRNELVYETVVIDPDDPSDDMNNMIALCPDCATKYRRYHTPLDIYIMKEIKKALLDAFENQDFKADQRVQEGVRKIIEKIPTIKIPSNVDLNYDPVPVRKKIQIDNIRLYNDIKTQVNLYYPDVHEAFQQMGREGKIRFTRFCEQVKYMYIFFRDKGYDQNKIFYEMTKWLNDATKEAWGDCQVVISYFVQKCEVFDDIA